MPFDPMPIESKPAIFSLDGLIAWLETQDPETEYCFAQIDNCLLSQYGYEVGLRKPSGHPAHDSNYHWRPARDMYDVALRHPHTFGAALTRARKLRGY